MGKVVEFSDVQRTKIAQSLEKLLGITSDETQQSFINSIEDSGLIRGFGFGSLLTYSHMQNSDGSYKDSFAKRFLDIDPETQTQTKPATLHGYEKDFVCYDIHYRGTPEEPGITLGLDQIEGGKTPGGVLETSLAGMSSDQAADFVQYYLEEFAAREMPPNMPIYTFDFLEVDVTNVGGVPALACIADNEGPLYIHNENNQFAQQDPVYHIARGDTLAKSEILAVAHGGENAPGAGVRGKQTNLDYLRDVIESSFEKDIPVETRFHDLYTMAVLQRVRLSEPEMEYLREMEPEGAHANLPEMLAEFSRQVGAHNASLEAVSGIAPEQRHLNS